MKEKDIILDKKFAKWHGIDRRLIKWYPEIKENKCIGCGLCFVTCGRDVFDFDEERKVPIVARPYHCMVGCSTCAVACPSNAIEFPGKELVIEAERKFKILRSIKERIKEKQLQIALRKAEYERDKLLNSENFLIYKITIPIFSSELLNSLKVVRNRGCQIVDFKVEIPIFCEDAPAVVSFKLIPPSSSWPEACPTEIKNLQKIGAVVAERRAS